MKKERLHYWLKQSRHMICFIAVVVFVFCYSLNAFAYTIDNTVSMASYFNIDSNVTYPIMTRSSAYSYASEDGIDTTKITSSIFSYYQGTSLNVSVSEWNNVLKNYYKLCTEYTDNNGITYDLENAYHFLSANNYGGGSYETPYMSFLGDYIVIINNYAVSESPFRVFNSFNITKSGSVGITSTLSSVTGVVNVNTAQANGLYCYQIISSQTNSGINMCDMDIFAPSTDGSTGFTNFSVTSTDFDFSADNYNFNFLKTGFGIISGSDPQPSTGGDFIDYAKSKMNFSMTSYYTGGKLLNNAKHDVSIIWPDVVKQNPENFYVVCDYTGRYKDNSLASTITFERQVLHGTTEKWIPVTEIMSRSGGKLPSSFDIDVGLNTLVDGNGKSMYRYFLESVSAFSGASVTSVENNSLWYQFLVDVGEAVSSWLGISDSEQPLAKLAQDIESYIDVMEIDGYVWIAYSDSVDTYSTGKNHTTFNFKTGDSSTVGTDNTINQYPAEGQNIYDITTPSGGSVGNTTNNYPITVNTQNNNNLNAMVEYLFNLDATSLANITGNIHNNFQYVIEKVSDTSENGFWAVLERTYSIIPAPIWTWILTSVGVILAGCTYSWVINGVRIRRG